jgi:fumarate reductase subunit C
MAARRPYIRPMDGWWRRNPFFLRYMMREATALFVYLYALALLLGIAMLANGEAAFNEWAEAMRSGLGLGFQLVCLAVFLYHTWSWFSIMPKTMAPIETAKGRIAASTITAVGLGAAAVCSLTVIALAWVLA